MTSNITIFNFDNNEVRVEMINDEPYFCGKDVATALGYALASKAVTDHCLRVSTSGRLNYRGNYFKMIPVEDVLRLIGKGKAGEGVCRWLLGLIENLTGQTYTLYPSRDESVALTTVEQLLNVQLERQYQVGPYKIDGYDAENNVAYEIDEPFHSGNKEKDEERQSFIEQELGCRFVRIKL